MSRSGRSVLLCEASEKAGGLVGSFRRGGLTFDSGIRAFENSGIIFPMLRELDIDMAVVSNPVTIGFENQSVLLSPDAGLGQYAHMLAQLFPESKDDIAAIVNEIQKTMGYMDVLYGIDNPLFGDVTKDMSYIVKTLLPWLLRYQSSMKKINRLNDPVYCFLQKFTGNRALIDMISQHFFKDTPASFALSYFSLYLDYSYPLGGTGVLAEKLLDKLTSTGGTMLLNTPVTAVNPTEQVIRTADGHTYGYKKLIWACDMTWLYRCLDTTGLSAGSTSLIEQQRRSTAAAEAGDSILTLYVTLKRDRSYYTGQWTAHSFYTPLITGLSQLPNWDMPGLGQQSPDARADSLKTWIRDYLALTTYEISIPVLRDPSLAPPGKTGLIISSVFDYRLVKLIGEDGWYELFKQLCAETIIEIFDRSAFPFEKADVENVFCATPLTLERHTHNKGGAVTGWGFSNRPMPAVNSMQKIAQAVKTPIPHVYQAGHWTFSPAGLPIAVLTGKLAADAVAKALRRKDKRSGAL